MEKNRVKKIEIPRWGNFYFSKRYDEYRIYDLVSEASLLYHGIKDLPILPQIFSRLEEELIRRSIFGTAAIEGNPLTEEEVGKIISQKDKVNTTRRAEQEIVNLRTAYESIRYAQKDDNFLLTEEIIQNAHVVITAGIDDESNTPGEYRFSPCKVGDKDHGGTYHPPKELKFVKMLMKEFITFMKNEETISLHPFLRAALAHYHLGLIHPFGDGNGRTARLIEALIIKNAGIRFVPPMLSNYYYSNIDDYFWAFSLARKNREKDLTPFLEFVMRGIIESLKAIKEDIIGFIRVLTLKDYFRYLLAKKELTHRRYDLLNFLLDYNKSFTLHDLFHRTPFNALYRDVSERTARRDIQLLLKRNILIETEKSTYEINLRLLDIT